MLKKYNKLRKVFTELKDGEQFCKVCHGEGMVKARKGVEFKNRELLVCHACYGTGKLDWVEKVVGKKSNLFITLPLIRKMYPRLIAQDILSVQPAEGLNEKEKP